MENKVFDSVKFPSHYVIMDGKFEVRHLVEDRLRSLKQSTYKPNNPLIYSNYADAIEYLLRFHLKNGVQDLKKAQQVIQFMIDAYEMESELVLDELVKDDASAYERAMARTNSDQVSDDYYTTVAKAIHKNVYKDDYKMYRERGPF